MELFYLFCDKCGAMWLNEYNQCRVCGHQQVTAYLPQYGSNTTSTFLQQHKDEHGQKFAPTRKKN